MKLAILQMADQGPAMSTALMLRTAGYRVVLPNDQLRAQLREAGCDTVLSPADLSRGMGYDPLDIEEVGPDWMAKCDLFCDIKAHRSYPKLVKRWPRLEKRILWTRINGGRPEHVIKPSGEDCGDEVNPPCPVLTPDLWYRQCLACEGTGTCYKDDDGRWNCGCDDPNCEANQCGVCGGTGNPSDNAYACWPPFCRVDDYYPVHGRAPNGAFEAPICLIHNVEGWGYQALVENVRTLGVACYGAGSPDGLVAHRHIPRMLSQAKCMVHLKSSDAPGYSLYEALAAACPVICTRRLIWRCRMGDLLEPGKTCLVFDRETHDGLSQEDVRDCTRELACHLAELTDPATNRRIGQAGRERLKQVMWSENRPADVESLKEFMARHFGGRV